MLLQVHTIVAAVVTGDSTKVSCPDVVMAVLASLPNVAVTFPLETSTCETYFPVMDVGNIRPADWLSFGNVPYCAT